MRSHLAEPARFSYEHKLNFICVNKWHADLTLVSFPVTAICTIQAQTANIFARLFTFETGRLPLETECFTAHVTCYSAKPNSVIFDVLSCTFQCFQAHDIVRATKLVYIHTFCD